MIQIDHNVMKKCYDKLNNFKEKEKRMELNEIGRLDECKEAGIILLYIPTTAYTLRTYHQSWQLYNKEQK